MKHLLIIVFVFASACTWAMSLAVERYNNPVMAFSYPRVAQSGKTIGEFVPAGWKIKDKTLGDLNKDQSVDAALVLEYHDVVNENRDGGIINKAHPRILVILLKNAGGYTLACQQNTFILREGEGAMVNDPYAYIKIIKGVLNIHFEYVRSNLNYKFRYQDNDFYLIGATNSGVERDMLYQWDFNFSTRKAVHSWGETIDGDKPGKTEQKQINISRPKKLSELAEPFAWNIFKDTSI